MKAENFQDSRARTHKTARIAFRADRFAPMTDEHRRTMRPDDPSLTKTDWSMIHEASGDAEDAAAIDALENLARRYWPAVYAYIRSTGRDIHEASDLTQGFVCDVIIARKLFAAADPERGRFRSLLHASLRNYLVERQRHENAAKRKPQIISSVVIDPDQLASMDSGIMQSPDEAFALQWSATLVRRVLEQVRQSCFDDAMEAHWMVFEARVARPMLLGEPAARYSDLVNRLDLEDASQAANMMVTVKRRFARALYAEVSRTVRDPEEAGAELDELLQKLGTMKHMSALLAAPQASRGEDSP